MKKIIPNIILATILLGTGIVYAESTEIKNPKPLLAPAMMLKDAKDKIASSTNASSTREKFGEKMEKIIDNRYQKMIDRLEATIERENSIMTRIISRIEKIKSVGGNTSDAEKSVADAKTYLDKAKTALLDLKTGAETVGIQNASSAPKLMKEGMDKMRKASLEIEKNLREVHKLLLKSVSQLRGTMELKNTSTTKEKNNSQN